jgi:hypothetical protein
VLHQHRLDLVAVVQPEEALRRLPVARALHDDRLDGVEREAIGEKRGAQLLGQRRDRVEVLRELARRGAVELVSAVALQAVRRGERRAVLVAGAARFLAR